MDQYTQSVPGSLSDNGDDAQVKGTRKYERGIQRKGVISEPGTDYNTQQINIRGGKTRSPLVYEVKATKTNPNKLTKRQKTTFWQNLYPKLRKQIEVQVMCEKKIFYTLNLTKANAR